MNWDAIGAIGEVIGATAVVVSLVYLASQVLVSNRLARAEAWRVPNSDLNSINASFGTDPVFRTALNKAMNEDADRTGCDTDECMALDMYLISILNIYEQIYREIREGTLKEDAIHDFGAKALIMLPYFRGSWFLYKHSLGPSFVSYFEQHLMAETVQNAT
ncbi:MAG: hypothetical protein AB8C02_13490 [Halioglobus sp.]